MFFRRFALSHSTARLQREPAERLEETTTSKPHRSLRDKLALGLAATAAATTLSAYHGNTSPPSFHSDSKVVASVDSLRILGESYATYGTNTARDRIGLGPTKSSATQPAARADAVAAAIEKELAIGDSGFYRGELEGPNVASVWPLGQIIAGDEDHDLLTGGHSANPALSALNLYDLVDTTEAYAPGIAPGITGSDRYIDDNLWIALDLLQDYQTTGNVSALHQAEGLYDFFKANTAPGGGLHWVERTDSPSRNAVSNLPTVEYGVRLYQLTVDQKYLDLAKECDAFVESNLRSPSGLIWDNVSDAGHLDTTFYSYNQGTAVARTSALPTHPRRLVPRARGEDGQGRRRLLRRRRPPLEAAARFQRHPLSRAPRPRRGGAGPLLPRAAHQLPGPRMERGALRQRALRG